MKSKIYVAILHSKKTDSDYPALVVDLGYTKKVLSYDRLTICELANLLPSQLSALTPDKPLCIGYIEV